MIVCGIDPGLSGGIAFADEHHPIIVSPLPKLNRVLDVVALGAILNQMEARVIIIERQSIRNGQGGALTIGANYGRILATCEILGWKYKLITAAQWKKKAGFPVGVKGKEKKEAAFELCRRDFGDRVMMEMGMTVGKDGPNEALLITQYG